MSAVTELNLEYNNMGKEGAKALAAALPRSNVMKFFLPKGSIDNVVATLLKADSYRESAHGTKTCPGGYQPIEHVGDCHRAAASLGKTWKGEGSWPLLPYGCINVWNSTYPVLWNTHQGTLDERFANICVQGHRLSDRNIGEEVARTLRTALSVHQVTTLNLSSKDIDGGGAYLLGAALSGSKVTVLDLHSNRIGDQGAKALAAALPDSDVTELFLSDN